MIKVMYDVFMLLKCSGLEYDDRVRKECLSLKAEGLNTVVHLIKDDNTSGRGTIFESDTAFVKHRLYLRDILPGNKWLLLKLFEIFFKIIPASLNKHKIVWLHDPIMFVFVPYFALLRKIGRVEKIVWDQHELPPQFILNKSIFRKLYFWSMKLADTKIHANKRRAEYLNDKLEHNFDYEILHNFVDDDLVNEPAQELPIDVQNWLDKNQFVLLQSGAYIERWFDSVAEAFCSLGSVKCVVVGGNNVDLEQYKKRFTNFNDVFYFVGMIPQIRLVDYIDAASISLILYNSERPNSLLCEPNRLYQASSRGTPVITGNNPPMRDFVKENNCGEVLEDDGANYKYIIDAVNLNMRQSGKSNRIIAANWSTQKPVFEKIADTVA